MSRDVSIIVPTYNEAGNVAPLIERLTAALEGIDWEVIFVDDDSPDQTRDQIIDVASRDERIRLIHRVGRRGLSSACIEGMLASTAPVVAVMDADLQHDERIIPDLYRAALSESIDVAIGSRYVSGGDAHGLRGARMSMSRGATWLTGHLTSVRVADPMSGFFALKRSLLLEIVHRLSGRGFKILLDILISSRRPLVCREIPFTFRPRHTGESKLDTAVLWEFALLLLTKFFGNRIPVRFLMFVFVGGLGIAIHFLVLDLMLWGLDLSFTASQLTALIAAMTSNFFFNNLFTYRDLRLRGWQLLRGLAGFYVACSLGAIVNIATAEYLYERGAAWWMAGCFGAISGAVWNFSVSSVFTWQGSVKKGA